MFGHEHVGDEHDSDCDDGVVDVDVDVVVDDGDDDDDDVDDGDDGDFYDFYDFYDFGNANGFGEEHVGAAW